MRKWIMALVVAFILAFSLSPKTSAVQAKESEVISRGDMIYQQNGCEAAWYTEDLFLLKGRLTDMPEEPFDPLCYTHTHQWEYRDINEKTHTRHCGVCGSAYDLTGIHTACREESHSITYNGKTYSGRRYYCVCGYQWVRESAHELVFETADETNHRIKCALDGSGFCRGYEPIEEEHYAYAYVPCQDGVHHKMICIDCGYIAGEEDCRFLDKPNADEEDDRDPDLLYCECGNGQAAPEETPDIPESSEQPDMTVSPAVPDPSEENPPETEEAEETAAPEDAEEENPAEGTGAEEAPIPEEPSEESSDEDADVGEPSVSEKPSEETLPEAGDADEPPALEAPAGENPVENDGGNETPIAEARLSSPEVGE